MIDIPTCPADIAAQAARAEAKALCDRLKPDELETLVLLCKGMSLQDVADALNLSLSTVAWRSERVRARLGVKKGIEAAVIATKAGLV